jgi:hypothetical protein
MPVISSNVSPRGHFGDSFSLSQETIDPKQRERKTNHASVGANLSMAARKAGVQFPGDPVIKRELLAIRRPQGI